MDYKYFMILVYGGTIFVDDVLGVNKIFQPCGHSKPFQAMITYAAPHIKKYNATINGCLQDEDIDVVMLLSVLNVVEAGTFVNLRELTRIDMTNSNVQLLKEKFFDNTPKLENIIASYNRLTAVGKGIFNYLSLGTLDLNSNMIDSIEDRAFANFNVEMLDLSCNYLIEVKEMWFRDTTISSLILNHNKIVFLNKKSFARIKNLTHVNLNYNGLFYIEDKTFSQHQSLTELHLAGNVLSDLHFLSDVKLRLLDVGFNKLSDVVFDNTTEIQQVLIYPNPWECSRLRKFWAAARQRKMRFGYSFTEMRPWDDRNPVCLARQNCDGKHCCNELHNSYFKVVNYAHYGSYRKMSSDVQDNFL